MLIMGMLGAYPDIYNIVNILREVQEIDDKILNAMNKNERIEKRRNDYKENGFIVTELNNQIVGFCKFIKGEN